MMVNAFYVKKKKDLSISPLFLPEQSCDYDTYVRLLSHDVTSESDITPCNKIDKLLVVYRFSNVR